MKEAGIYTITHLRSAAVYVSQANNIRQRWRDHRSGLRKGSHHNAPLQRLWILSQETDFSFEVASLAPSGLTPLALQRWLVTEERRVLERFKVLCISVNETDPEIVATNAAVKEYKHEIQRALAANDERVCNQRKQIKRELERLRVLGAPDARRLHELQSARRAQAEALQRTTGWRGLIFGRPPGFDRNRETVVLARLDAEIAALLPSVRANATELNRLEGQYKGLYTQFSKVMERRWRRRPRFFGSDPPEPRISE
jgi:hypothetical protein